MALLEVLSDTLGAIGSFQSSGVRPRRVFTRGFVAFCVMVAVLELIALNQFYAARA